MRRLALVSTVILLSILGAPTSAISSAIQSDTPRRVYAPYFPDTVTWAQTAVFWFGQNKQGIPSRNYVDVRVAYTSESLQVRVTVVDYYLWYKKDATLHDDLTLFDAVALYLDTGHDRSTFPLPDDYSFLLAARHWPTEDAPAYRRQARGTGSGWDASWPGLWLDRAAMQWSCDPGPNSNVCGIDFGWTGLFTIPWGTLGRSGPPSQGTLWGLGVRLYDRDDDPPAGYVEPDHWPPLLDPANPATWGELHFGYADYQAPAAVPEGTVLVRAASPEDSTVEDAWMGGGGLCSGGHMGGSEINHGADTGLYVGTETAPTHFPCFSKSYLRFALDAIPAGRAIISATLSLHVWGNAGADGEARPSWVHLFTIRDPWDEMLIHWNNAPLPYENISATWIYPMTSPLVWPGVAYEWDATQAVAEAYALGRSVSLAIYGSDTDQHSSKYMTSSETGDWNIAGRPALRVVWGQPAASVRKAVDPAMAVTGQQLTYTFRILGSGRALTLTDPLPAGLSIAGPIWVSEGVPAYDNQLRCVQWSGIPGAGQAATVTFPVTVTAVAPAALRNTVTLTDSISHVTRSSVTVIVNGFRLQLPITLRVR